MRASKENARRAHAWLKDMLSRCKWIAAQASIVEEGEKFIEDFLLASERKLPTEASYDKDKSRKANK